MRPTAAPRLLPLDALRGAAALGVALIYHYRHFTDTFPLLPGLVFPVWQYGTLLVDLFFVLSGFVFAHVYGERIARGAVGAYRFAVYRFSRLYPLHLAALLAVAALHAVRRHAGLSQFIFAGDARDFLAHLLLLQNGMFDLPYSFNGPAWSIASEETAYILFFLICCYAYRFRLALAAGAVAAGLLLLAAGFTPLGSALSRLLLGFFAGVLLHALDRRLLTARAQLAYVAASLAAYALFSRLPSTEHAWPAVLFFFPPLLLAVLRLPLLAALLNRPFATRLGDLSFAVYMLHYPVQLLLRTADELGGWHLAYDRPAVWCLYAALVLVAATVSYHCYELPAKLYLRRRLTPQRTTTGNETLVSA